jgi:glycosyltransferase involved in cell wall biosynthesis
VKIAYIGIKGLPAKGGADRVVEAIVHRLSHQHEVTVYCSRDFTPPSTRLPNVRLILLPTLKGKHLRSTSLFLFAALHALFLQRFDVVHIHNVEATFIAPLLRLRFPVISTSHGTIGTGGQREKWSRWAQTLMNLTEYTFMYCSDFRSSVSSIDSRYLQGRYHRPVQYIPNGVELSPFVDDKKAQTILRQHGLSSGDFILFAAGRIDPTKGCHLAIEAFQKLKGDLKLAIVGELGHKPAYDRQLRDMADSRVHFIPLITSREELFGVIQNSRLFVFPSTLEAMSMMLLEVGALGVPVICSDIPANSFLAEHTIFFNSGDSLSLFEKLKWALDNPNIVSDLAKEAQFWIRQSFPWDQIVQKYDKVYQLIGKKQSKEDLTWRM